MLLEITEKSEVFVTSLVLFNKSNFFVNKPQLRKIERFHLE